MSPKTVFKILLDIVMTVLYLMLMFGGALSDFFHEVAGIGIFILFVVHVIINIKPLSSMLKVIKEKKATTKIKLMFALNMVLIVGMPVVLVTGIMISKALFFTGVSDSWMTIYNIHNITSYICLGVLGAHMLAHTKYIIAAVKGIIKNIKTNEVKKTIGRFSTGAFAIAFAYIIMFQLHKISNSSEIPIQQTTSIITTELEKEISSNSEIIVEDEITAQADDHENDEETTYNSSAQETEITDNSENETISNATSADAPAEALEEYLGKLICTACGRHCPLSNPRCGKSASQIQSATADYNALYSIES